MPRPRPAWAPSRVRMSNGAAREAPPGPHQTVGGHGSQEGQGQTRRNPIPDTWRSFAEGTKSVTSSKRTQRGRRGGWPGSSRGRGERELRQTPGQLQTGWAQQLLGQEAWARLPPSLGLGVLLSNMVRTEGDNSQHAASLRQMCRWGHRGLERLCDLPKGTQQVSERVGLESLESLRKKYIHREGSETATSFAKLATQWLFSPPKQLLLCLILLGTRGAPTELPPIWFLPALLR